MGIRVGPIRQILSTSIMSQASAVPQTGAFYAPPHTIVVVEDEVLIRSKRLVCRV
jgi:hypothetical protein